LGNTGSFEESDLDANREITITHERNTLTPYVFLVEDSRPLSYNDEYVIIKVVNNSQFTIRIFKPNLQTTKYRVI
jgi:hypothetical protein